VVLPADESEAVAELEQERLEPRDQGVLEVAFGGGLGEVEEVQDVGVAGELLGELAVGGGELGWEVGGCSAGSAVKLVHDLVEQDVAGPALLHGRCGVVVPATDSPSAQPEGSSHCVRRDVLRCCLPSSIRETGRTLR